MPHVPKWRRYLHFWRPDVEADVDHELRFHFEERMSDLGARGLSSDEARRRALKEFGDVEATRRRLTEIGHRLERRRRKAHGWQLVAGDLRYTLRALRVAPLLTVGVVLTLALGIGAAVTMYGTMRQLLVQPPPHVAAAEGLMRPYFHLQRSGDSVRTGSTSTYLYFERLQEDARTIAVAGAYIPQVELAVGDGPDARLAQTTLVSAGFWRALGTRPRVGRFITDEEAHPATGARVAVLGHAFWQRRYGGDTSVVGTTLHVKGLPYQVVGVAPRGFRGVELADTDLWLPLFAADDGQEKPASWRTFTGYSTLRFVVRPAPPATPQNVEVELSRTLRSIIEHSGRSRPPEMREQLRSHVTVAGLTGALGHDGRRIPEGTVAVWIAGVAGILLLVACANVASLLLLRALRRRREIAVRLALGMSRRRLGSMLFGESLVLALLGGVAATAAVAAGGAWVRATLLPGMISERAGVDWHTVLLAAGAVVLVALLTGLAPVLQAGADPAHGLRDGAQHGATRRSRLYHGLLIAQTALSTVLLVGAGLFLQSLHRVTTVDLGLDAERSLVVRVDFTGTGRSGEERVAFFERALERVRATPGVEAAGLGFEAPLHGASGVAVRTHATADWVQAKDGVTFGNDVSDGFFEATGMRIAAGRGFRPEDRAGESVIVVNETLAALGWPGRSPVGECAYLSVRDACARIIGVVRDARSFRVDEEAGRPWVYRILGLNSSDSRALLVHTAADPAAMRTAIDRALREIDPALPYVDVQRLGDVLDPQLRSWRLGATVFTAFGLLAMLLATLGLYTAVAYAVSQRTREIGVRIAVGASRLSVVGLILGDGARVAALGVVTGLMLSVAGGRWVAGLLYETSPREPLVLAAVAAGLLVVAALASLLPARRAARVSPMEALRVD